MAKFRLRCAAGPGSVLVSSQDAAIGDMAISAAMAVDTAQLGRKSFRSYGGEVRLLFAQFDKRPFNPREVLLNECTGGRPERATPAYFRPTSAIIAFTLILNGLSRIDELYRAGASKTTDRLSY
jgi:hypothetical protein